MKGFVQGADRQSRTDTRYRNALMIESWTRATLFGRSMRVRRCAGTCASWGSIRRDPGRRLGLWPGYHPSPMLASFIFMAISSRVQSESAAGAREACRNLEVMWLTGAGSFRITKPHRRFPQRQRPCHQEGLRAICCLVPQRNDGSWLGESTKRVANRTAARFCGQMWFGGASNNFTKGKMDGALAQIDGERWRRVSEPALTPPIARQLPVRQWLEGACGHGTTRLYES